MKSAILFEHESANGECNNDLEVNNCLQYVTNLKLYMKTVC